jgi:preprotein translocase subunit SecB
MAARWRPGNSLKGARLVAKKTGATKNGSEGTADKPAEDLAAVGAAGAAPEAQAGGAPTLNVIGQYVKDLSFENPNAPASLTTQAKNPSIQININVNARNLAESNYEVDLSLEAKAIEGEKVIFNVELTYSGLFSIQNVPQDSLQPVVLIECPRLLFPFARQIVANAARDGGFPPLMIDPIDFAALYRQRMAEQEPQQA